MVARSRREFLRTAIGACAAAPLFALGPGPKTASPRGRKAVVVTFGGGARDDETFTPEGQENIPHLLTEALAIAPALHPATVSDEPIGTRELLAHCTIL